MSKVERLRSQIEALPGTTNEHGIKICPVLESPLEQEVRLFYEAHPYHKELPTDQLETRLAKLKHDWANWCIPATLEGCRTLDVGCGCGVNLVLHAALAEFAVGIDLSLSALYQAHHNLMAHNVLDWATLVRGDIRAFNLESGAFDLITCIGVLHHIPDHMAALANIARLLDRRGLLLLGVYHPGGRSRFRLKRSLLQTIIRNPAGRFYWAKRLFNIQAEAAQYHIPPDIYIWDSYIVPVEKAFSVRELAHALKHVGLSLVQVRPSPSRAFDPGIEQAARRPQARDLQRVDQALRQSRRHHYWCLAIK